MALTKADLKAIADMIAASGSSAPRARSRTKVAKDTRTMAERRTAAVGGRCDAHDQNFATAAGYTYHMSRTDIEHAQEA